MRADDLTPARLAVQLILYFAVFFGTTVLVVKTWPEALRSLPVGGHDALDAYVLSSDTKGIPGSAGNEDGDFEITTTFRPASDNVGAAIAFLSLHLTGTILIMIPISWTYMATRRDIGYRKNFARALLVLPICATTIVLLIQDSLALAFGLAALVAAVRFRVTLNEAIDGVFVFAAICVGLAAGIGYLGIAAIMAVFFCFTSLVLWHKKYGENPVDQAIQERKRAKLAHNDKSPPPDH